MTAAYNSSRDRKSRSRQSRRRAPYRLQLEPLEERLLLATYVVNSIGDEPDSNIADAVCDNGTGLCTLRAAIDQANATANVGGVPDEIHFNISGSSVHTISPTSALPSIMDPIFINGYTQPKNDGSGQLAKENTNGAGLGLGINAVPLIELDGSNAGGTHGLTITAGSSVVRGLVINRFQGSGILLASNGNVVAGNFIGTSATGDADLGNGASGVEITDNIGPIVDSSNNTIGGTAPADRNLISGNNGNGVHIIVFGQQSDLTGNNVLGNLIGTDKAGTTAIGNNSGVRLEGVSGGHLTGNLIGGTTAAARNVISGNAGSADILVGGPQVFLNSIQGNFIGTDVTGTVGLAGATNGVNLSTGSFNNLIGGDDAADGVVDGIVGAANVISGHPAGTGVPIDGGSSANHVEGNRIGTNAAGTAAIPNGFAGVHVAGAAGNFVGGATAGAGNLISGNSSFGVALRDHSSNNVVQGNRIGTGLTGANPIPNGSLGIDVFEGSNNNLIGGTGAGEGNVVAFNLRGVGISDDSTGNSILGNSIFSNNELGIDLGGGDVAGNGVTENDLVPGDPDAGANNLQNFPVLTSAVTTAGVTTITGTINSTPSSSFRIEFFSNTAADPSLHGEGQTLLKFSVPTDVMTDVNGDASFSFSPTTALATGLFVSATATKLEDTDQDPQTPLAPTDTSEFSTDVCSADQFTVVNTNDSGAGSLRQAILNANVHDNALNAGGVPDLISFCILGSGVHTISPTSALPTISDPVTIDGYTQPGSSANTLAVGNNAVLLIELDGTSGSGSAFLVRSPNNTFKGLVINRFPGASGDAGWGFRLLSAGNTIQGNYLGTNPAGDTALPNRGGGVSVEATSVPLNQGDPPPPSGNNLIGGATAAARNLILGGLQGFAIDINGNNADVFQGGIIGGDGNTVQGNYIGTNAAGSAMLGRSGIQILTKNNIIGGTTAAARNVLFANGGIGLNLSESNASGNTIQGNYIGINATGDATLGGNTDGISLLCAPNNTIGGTAAGAGNVISGNGGSGIGATDSDNLTIQGNLIGTNAAGTAAVPNGGFGIRFSGSSNTIGGTTPGARNIISANNAGIRLDVFSTTAGNLIQGNYIGTDITGTAALGNNNFGILIFAFQEPTGINTVGGTAAAARNIISANNGIGIDIRSANILVQGNYIGTDVNGTADLGNVTNGISIADNNDTIGGTTPGAGNTIAFNGELSQTFSGVIVGGSATGNAILGNSIFSNGRLGIDLSCAPGQGGACENASGVTANDPGDADTGGNNLQNFPVLESASIASGNLIVSGFARPGSLIEFFIADDGQATFGEGKTFLVRLTEGSAADTDGGTGTYGPGAVNGLSQGTDDTNRFSFTISVAGLPSPVMAGTVLTATATDASNNTSEFSGNVTVHGANNPPTVTLSPGNPLSVNEGTTQTYNFSINDPDGDNIASVTVSCGANGTQVGAATFTDTTGSFQCSFPDGPASSTVSASATDSRGATGAADMQTVTVSPVNDEPTASDTTASTTEDSTTGVAIDLAALVSDIETADADLTYTIVSGPSSGMLTGSGSSRTYVPNADFNGSDSFTYSVTDRGDPDNCGTVGSACAAPLTSATRTVTITVAPVNDAPSAIDSFANTVEDGSVPIDLAALVSDLETADANLSYTIVSPPTAGMLTGSGSSRTYVPNQDFNGVDSFTYSVTDRGDPDNCGPASATCAAPLTSVTRTISITVAPVNDTPTASNGTANTAQDSTTGVDIDLALLVSDLETADAGLTYTIVMGPSFGQLSGAGPTRTYVPNAGFNGSDSFTYSVTDRGDPDNCLAGPGCAPALTSAIRTVSITVGAANTPPTASDSTANTTEESSVPIDLAALVSDSETADADLTYTIVSGPSSGMLTGSGSSRTYVPSTNFNGMDSFTYSVTDRGSPDNCAPVGPNCSAPLTSPTRTITITVAPVNDTPNAGNGSASTTEDSATGVAIDLALLVSDIETADADLTYTIVTDPSSGMLSGSGASRTYVPNGDFNGSDSFTYSVTDRGDPDNCGPVGLACAAPLTSATRTVTIAVTPVNDAPTASNGSANTVEEMSVPIDLGALVSDIETADANLTYTIVSGPASGMLTGSGSSRTYVPNSNFNGMDSFTYSVTDRGDPDNCGPVGPACAAPLTSATRTISITVAPVNDTPSASNGSANTVQDSGTGVSIDLAALVSDIETADANLTYTIVSGPSSGMLSGNGASRSYVPNAGFNGTDSFTYSVTDRGDPDNCGPAGPNCSAPLTSAIRTVTITVASVSVGCRATLGTPPAPAGSGNVNARISRGRLVIQGDVAGNDIQIQAGATPGSFIVTGRGGTHVNNHAAPELFTGVTRGLQIRTGLGDDTVVFDGSLTPLNIPGGLNLRTDSGDDTVWLDPLRVDGRTAINTGTENDSVTIIDAILSDRLSLQTGSGDDELTMCSSEMEGRVRARTKSGTDSVAIDDLMFGSAVLVKTGNGNDRVQLERRSDAAGPTSVFRDRVRLKTKQGSDLIEIGVAAQAGNSAQFQDCVKILGGRSTDTLDAGLGTDPNGNGNSFDCGPSTRGIEVEVS